MVRVTWVVSVPGMLTSSESVTVTPGKRPSLGSPDTPLALPSTNAIPPTVALPTNPASCPPELAPNATAPTSIVLVGTAPPVSRSLSLGSGVVPDRIKLKFSVSGLVKVRV